MSQTQPLDLVTLEYQLDRLPSSQHRSGLAGLILKIQWLQQQPEFKASTNTVCQTIELDPHKATLKFNLAGLTALLRSHYSARVAERERSKPRATGQQNYQTIQRQVNDPVTGKTELKDFYIYQDIVPCGYLVQSFDPAANDSQIWTKLWQETTWGILRSRDKQRLPFKAMVNGTDPSEIEKIWKLLSDRPDRIVPLSSTHMLGVQSKNNEGLASSDRAKFYFLLHFWSYIAQIYLPIRVDAKDKAKLHGYAIAIPDIRNLAAFCQHFPAILQQRSTKSQWDKPKAAIVRHPIESGLFLMRSIHTYFSEHAPDLDINNFLFGIDIFYLFKQKDEPQILKIQRYLPDREAIEKFTQLENNLFDPTCRLQSWQNLIHNRPQITGFETLLRDLPFSKTIGNRWFCRDFRTLFYPQAPDMESTDIDLEPTPTEPEASESKPSPTGKEISLESILLRVLKKYMSHKLEHQFGIKWQEAWKNQKPEDRKQDTAYQAYRQKRELILRNLHMEFRRHRHPHEFLAYFAKKFTGIYQYLTTNEYLFLAEQIQTQPERIQILCLLALPAI